MDSPLPSDHFVGYLTSSQDRLRAYILACLGNYNAALDVLQATNVVLLKKARDFPSESDFQRWAISVAKYEVLAYVRDQSRGCQVFSPVLMELMSQEAERGVEAVSIRQQALRHCLSLLPEKKREYIRLRYSCDFSIEQIAHDLNRSSSAVKVMLHRIRKTLQSCVDQRLHATQTV